MASLPRRRPVCGGSNACSNVGTNPGSNAGSNAGSTVSDVPSGYLANKSPTSVRRQTEATIVYHSLGTSMKTEQERGDGQVRVYVNEALLIFRERDDFRKIP